MPRRRNDPQQISSTSLRMASDITRRPLCLRLYPDAILRDVAIPVERLDRHVLNLACDMLDLMRIHRGIGLAAPQVGLLLRPFVADVGEGPLAVVNPRLSVVSDATDHMSEGCLSLPDTHVNIERKRSLEIRGLDPLGKRVHKELSGLMARVVQHEVDHLNGILICDYADTSVYPTNSAIRKDDL